MATQKEPGEPQGKIRMWERNSRDAAVKVDRDRRDWGGEGVRIIKMYWLCVKLSKKFSETYTKRNRLLM